MSKQMQAVEWNCLGITSDICADQPAHCGMSVNHIFDTWDTCTPTNEKMLAPLHLKRKYVENENS